MSGKKYQGIFKEELGSMNPSGNIIRDAWVFGLLPETETCEGWTKGQIEALYDKVTVAWEPYGHIVSSLPDDLREKHQRIYSAAIKYARENGWDPDAELEEES
jgi:hypothetical protein